MALRERVSKIYGLPLGLDERNHAMRQAAGNAVIPAIAEWIARKLLTSIKAGKNPV